MKVRASVKADPSKGDKLVKRRGRLYVINKIDSRRKQRQKGPAKKKQRGDYMARKALVEKEKRRQKMVNNAAEKRAALKKIIKSFDSTEEEKMKAMDDLNKMKANSSKVRLHNRCKLTGRPKGFMRKFGVSRLCFREMALEGYIPGITKSSW